MCYLPPNPPPRNRPPRSSSCPPSHHLHGTCFSEKLSRIRLKSILHIHGKDVIFLKGQADRISFRCQGGYMDRWWCMLKSWPEHDQTKFENLQQNCWTKCTATPLPGVWHQVWFGRALSKHFTQCNTRTWKQKQETLEILYILKLHGSST